MSEPGKRLRELGIAIGALPTGRWNAITDVPGVRVGQRTVAFGDGPLVPGQGPARTGVTAILPHGGDIFHEKVPAAAHVINGFGKSIGLVQVDELGTLETPILLTNTLNVGRVADALIDHMLALAPGIGVTTTSVNPVVLECNDGHLNDLQGRHVHVEHVHEALATASDGPVAEGSVGAGTGMVAFGYKAGIGTASRVLHAPHPAYTVGALVLANTGRRDELRAGGVRVGGGRRSAVGSEDAPAFPLPPADYRPPTEHGSIIIVIATDAPCETRQLGRLARRAAFGLARTGATASHGSGDIALAFCTAPENRVPHRPTGPTRTLTALAEDGPLISALFAAVAEVTEEAILNSLFAAETMTGRDGHRVEGLPVADVLQLLAAHGAVEENRNPGRGGL